MNFNLIYLLIFSLIMDNHAPTTSIVNDTLHDKDRLRILEGKLEGILQSMLALQEGHQCLSTEISKLKTELKCDDTKNAPS